MQKLINSYLPLCPCTLYLCANSACASTHRVVDKKALIGWNTSCLAKGPLSDLNRWGLAAPKIELCQGEHIIRAVATLLEHHRITGGLHLTGGNYEILDSLPETASLETRAGLLVWKQKKESAREQRENIFELTILPQQLLESPALNVNRPKEMGEEMLEFSTSRLLAQALRNSILAPSTFRLPVLNFHEAEYAPKWLSLQEAFQRLGLDMSRYVYRFKKVAGGRLLYDAPLTQEQYMTAAATLRNMLDSPADMRNSVHHIEQMLSSSFQLTHAYEMDDRYLQDIQRLKQQEKATRSRDGTAQQERNKDLRYQILKTSVNSSMMYNSGSLKLYNVYLAFEEKDSLEGRVPDILAPLSKRFTQPPFTFI